MLSRLIGETLRGFTGYRLSSPNGHVAFIILHFNFKTFNRLDLNQWPQIYHFIDFAIYKTSTENQGEGRNRNMAALSAVFQIKSM